MAASEQTDTPRVFAVVLAAGESRRFGSPKQLARIGERTLTAIAADAARSVCGDRTVLVVGHAARDTIEAAEERCEFLLMNERSPEGMGTSVALAAKALAPVADAILLTLVDQPGVTAAHLGNLIDAWSGDDQHIVATGYGKDRGAPALLPSATFEKLAALDGDRGARELFADPAFDLSEVLFAPAAADVDSPADLEAFVQAAE